MALSSDNLAQPTIVSTNFTRPRTIQGDGHFAFDLMPGTGSSSMSDNGSVPIRIAVAEDEPDVRRTFVRLLECLGHKVVCSVANGEELIDQCKCVEVDIAFVDLDMPVVDGLAAAEIVSERGIPVILVSGHPDARQVVVEREPVVARIVKPASIDALKRAIEQAMASRTA